MEEGRFSIACVTSKFERCVANLREFGLLNQREGHSNMRCWINRRVRTRSKARCRLPLQRPRPPECREICETSSNGLGVTRIPFLCSLPVWRILLMLDAVLVKFFPVGVEVNGTEVKHRLPKRTDTFFHVEPHTACMFDHTSACSQHRLLKSARARLNVMANCPPAPPRVRYATEWSD